MAEKIRTLSAEEQALPIACFYDRPEVQPDAALADAFAEPLDPVDAVSPKQIRGIFNPEVKNGFCVLGEETNGGGYACFTTFYPGADLEMLKWYYPWRGIKSVNYTVSNSCHNHSVGMSDQQREKVCSPVLPLESKSRGIVQSLVKDPGTGELEDFVLHFQRPEEMEIEDQYLADDNLALFCGWWMRENRKCMDPYKKAIDMFADVCRQEEGGVCVKTFLWCGFRGLKGVNTRMDTYGPVIDETYVKTLALCMAQDRAQVASMLPELYETEKGDLV